MSNVPTEVAMSDRQVVAELKNRGCVQFLEYGKATLDGTFTVKELKAIIAIMQDSK